MEKTRKFAVNRGEFFESTGKESFCRNVTPVPSVSNVYYFFMNCHDAGRFVRCGFVYVIVCYVAANCQCCRAPLFSRVVSRMVPRISCPYRLHVATRHGAARAAKWSRRLCVVPRIRMLPLIHGAAFTCAAAHQCCRASVWPRICGSAHSYTAAHLCCRALSHVAAQLYMLPRSSTYDRASVLRFRAVLHIAAHCRLWPRSARCFRAPIVPRAAPRFESSPVLPRSVLYCYKRAVRTSVGVSRSTAV